jgi:hypothetical protein
VRIAEERFAETDDGKVAVMVRISFFLRQGFRSRLRIRRCWLIRRRLAPVLRIRQS